MRGLTRPRRKTLWAGKPGEHLASLFEPLRGSRGYEEGQPGKDFFKFLLMVRGGSLCVFTMTNKHVSPF